MTTPAFGITPAAARMANRAARDLGLDFDLFTPDDWARDPDTAGFVVLQDQPDQCSALATLLHNLAELHEQNQAGLRSGPGQGQLSLFDY